MYLLKNIRLVLIIEIVFLSSLFGQVKNKIVNYPSSIEDTYRLSVNNISIPLNSKGMLGSVPINDTSRGFINGDLFLYSAGFYLSGYNERGELWANSVSLGREDYIEGNSGSDSSNPKNKLYMVKQSDPHFGESWSEWKDAVELGANFYDGNNNGIYEPIDLNENGLWDIDEDKPEILGDETIWCVYNDGKPANQREWIDDPSKPQGIEIRQTLWAYSDESELDNIVFLKYSILNSGDSSSIHDSVYFSLWTDPDLVRSHDDLGGCDTNINSGYVYNDGSIPIENNEMCFLSSLLEVPNLSLDNQNNNILMNSFYVSFARLPLNRPGSILHARNLLTGKNIEGKYTDPCSLFAGSVFGSNCNNVNPRFLFSGDPVKKNGWIDTISTDVKIFLNTGPFKLEAGKPVDIIAAYIVGRDTSALSSVTLAKQMAGRAQQFYESNFTEYPLVSVEKKTETIPQKYILHQNYPNPFNPTTTIKYTIPKVASGLSLRKTTLIVYDILGREVSVLENKQQRAGNYKVILDASFLSSGVYYYQLRSGDYMQTKKMILLK